MCAENCRKLPKEEKKRLRDQEKRERETERERERDFQHLAAVGTEKWACVTGKPTLSKDNVVSCLDDSIGSKEAQSQKKYRGNLENRFVFLEMTKVFIIMRCVFTYYTPEPWSILILSPLLLTMHIIDSIAPHLPVSSSSSDVDIKRLPLL